MSNVVSFPELGLEFDVSRVAFSIGGFNVYWYGVFITMGLIIALAYLFYNSKRIGVDSDRMIDVVIGGMIGAIIGARLYFVIFSWDEFKYDLLSIFSTRGGGMAFYGGLIGALIVGGLVCKWRKVKIRPMFDLAGIGFLIGSALGRWGNFFNVEAYGSNTSMPWGMTSTKIQSELAIQASDLAEIGVNIDPTQPVHPTFFYEFLWCIIGVLLLHFYSKRRKFDGEIFLMYLAWYGFGRFWIEGLRTDSLMIGSLRISQVLSAVLVVAAIIFIILMRKKTKELPEGQSALYAESPEWQRLIGNTSEESDETDSDGFEDTEKLEDDHGVEEALVLDYEEQNGESDTTGLDEFEETEDPEDELEIEEAVAIDYDEDPNEEDVDNQEEVEDEPKD